MDPEIEVNVEVPESETTAAEAAVEIAHIEAETIERRVTALAEALAELRGAREEIIAIRGALTQHIAGNESDFAAVMLRLDQFEGGLAVMREALEEEATIAEELLREELREEMEEEEHDEHDEHDEHHEPLESGEVPAHVEDAEEAEPAPLVEESAKHKRRHFVSLFGGVRS